MPSATTLNAIAGTLEITTGFLPGNESASVKNTALLEEDLIKKRVR